MRSGSSQTVCTVSIFVKNRTNVHKGFGFGKVRSYYCIDDLLRIIFLCKSTSFSMSFQKYQRRFPIPSDGASAGKRCTATPKLIRTAVRIMSIAHCAYYHLRSLHTRSESDLITEIPVMPIFNRLLVSVICIHPKHTLRSSDCTDKRMMTGLAFMKSSFVHSPFDSPG